MGDKPKSLAEARKLAREKMKNEGKKDPFDVEVMEGEKVEEHCFRDFEKRPANHHDFVRVCPFYADYNWVDTSKPGAFEIMDTNKEKLLYSALAEGGCPNSRFVIDLVMKYINETYVDHQL